MSPEQRRLILGEAGMALVDRDAEKNDYPPSPAQVARLRAIFSASGRNRSHVRPARAAA